MEQKLGTLIYNINRTSSEERKSLDPLYQFGIDLIEVKQNKEISYVCAAISMPRNFKFWHNYVDFSSMGLMGRHQIIQEILNNAIFICAYIVERDPANEFNPRLTKIRLYEKIIKKAYNHTRYANIFVNSYLAFPTYKRVTSKKYLDQVDQNVKAARFLCQYIISQNFRQLQS
jgi:hypothetical protein